jgi:hypothetical protein
MPVTDNTSMPEGAVIRANGSAGLSTLSKMSMASKATSVSEGW